MSTATDDAIPGESTRQGTEGVGLLASLGRLTTTVVEIARTRIDLLASDIEEDRAHFLSLLVLALVSLFCIGVGVVLASILVVVVFWETYRMPILGVLAMAFLAAGSIAAGMAVRAIKAKPKLFSASMAELAKDKKQLTGR